MQKYSAKQLFFAGLLGPLVLGLIVGIGIIIKTMPAQAEAAHIRGNKNAKVKLVEYSDFQCPFCERHYPTLKKILADYGDQVSLEYKHFPLNSIHPYAQKAAEASECASEQGKFWEFHDKAFENQQNLNFDALKQWAADLKLNTTRFNNCLDSGKYAAKVQAQEDEGVKLGVDGTPGTLINGQLVSGALPYDAFKQIIDQQLQK